MMSMWFSPSSRCESRRVAKREITYLARTALPLFVLMLVAVLATYFVQDIVLWLPGHM